MAEEVGGWAGLGELSGHFADFVEDDDGEPGTEGVYVRGEARGASKDADLGGEAVKLAVEDERGGLVGEFG
jgi:hypothetical protein